MSLKRNREISESTVVNANGIEDDEIKAEIVADKDGDDDDNDNDDGNNDDDDDDNDSDNDDDDDDDHKCTTCGTVTEKLYYCNRIDNQTMNCENNEKLCYNCNEHRWKLSCVKCKSWDCVDCIEFDREGGDLGTDFRSEVYALDPKACSKCKRIFCKECSNRCHRCKLCFCQEEQIHSVNHVKTTVQIMKNS